MKRLAFSMIAAGLLAAAAIYYGQPQWIEPVLVDLNRRLAGLAERTALVADHEVHYLEGGRGTPVVLLHGIFGEKDHWVDFARRLTGRHHVFVPDLPGYGESGRHAGHVYDYAAQVERLRLLLDRLGVARAHLAGSSMGGTVAALFALRYPERVTSVAFIGAPHGIRTPVASTMDRLIERGESPLIARDPNEFERMLTLVFERRPFLPHPILAISEQRAIADAESNRRLWHEQLKDRHLLDDRLGALRLPTFVLWGQADRVFDVSGVQVIGARLPGSRTHGLPGIGHLPMMEAPEQAAGLYAGFLATLER